ncbi:unnamed protein product [Rangifer tarandus platyrhynchus]|uniref:Uncharacterized protein n=1 Tax=Rangifer tarandus platyrhynchus TaxID=3082113 RepID=A0AC59ZFF0_RANTA
MGRGAGPDVHFGRALGRDLLPPGGRARHSPPGEDRLLLHAVLPSRGSRRYGAKRLEVFSKLHQTNLRESRLLQECSR